LGFGPKVHFLTSALAGQQKPLGLVICFVFLLHLPRVASVDEIPLLIVIGALALHSIGVRVTKVPRVEDNQLEGALQSAIRCIP